VISVLQSLIKLYINHLKEKELLLNPVFHKKKLLYVDLMNKTNHFLVLFWSFALEDKYD